jgi:hypothetical protein
VHNDFVFAGQADMEYLGLRMVDPDDRMEMCCHVLVLLGRDRLACVWSIFGLIRAREASSTRRRLINENYRSGASPD